MHYTQLLVALAACGSLVTAAPVARDSSSAVETLDKRFVYWNVSPIFIL
jgi:hypothetical protein